MQVFFTTSPACPADERAALVTSTSGRSEATSLHTASDSKGSGGGGGGGGGGRAAIIAGVLLAVAAGGAVLYRSGFNVSQAINVGDRAAHLLHGQACRPAHA
jgi:hypothetical protein